MMAIDMVSIPITLEQLITAVQQLQPEERAEVCQSVGFSGFTFRFEGFNSRTLCSTPG